jgi:hypothetical protein
MGSHLDAFLMRENTRTVKKRQREIESRIENSRRRSATRES